MEFLSGNFLYPFLIYVINFDSALSLSRRFLTPITFPSVAENERTTKRATKDEYFALEKVGFSGVAGTA